MACSNTRENVPYLDEIYIWKPPKGIDIFCISNKLLDVCVYDKSLLSNNDFTKFYKYGQINDVNYIFHESNKFNAPIVPKIICYHTKDIKAYKKAQKIAKYLNEETMHTERNKNYVINKYLINMWMNWIGQLFFRVTLPTTHYAMWLIYIFSRIFIKRKMLSKSF